MLQSIVEVVYETWYCSISNCFICRKGLTKPRVNNMILTDELEDIDNYINRFDDWFNNYKINE